MKTPLYRTLRVNGPALASFTSGEYPMDPLPVASVGLYITNAVGLAGSAFVEATINNQKWIPLTGTERAFSGNENKLWVLEALNGVRQIRVQVIVSAGIADFEIDAGAG